MSNTILIRRGLEANRTNITPAEGEPIVTTDETKLYVGDGTTAGGNLAAGGERQYNFTASGAITAGDPVIVNNSGLIEAVNLNLTSENFVGFATQTLADTETGVVSLRGSVNEDQTGLTPGATYYVQTNGSLSTTPDTPSVVAGVALSATEILVKG